MITKKYIKKAYILEAFCDKCGSPMIDDGIVYDTFPETYPYHCTNPNCNGKASFFAHECPGIIHYEFEDDLN